MRFLKNIKYISPTKFLNLCRLEMFYLLAKCGKIGKKVPLPYFASFEPTNVCNLSCEMCPSGKGLLKRERGFADFKTFKKFVDENFSTLITLILHFQGEPLMCDNLGKMISYARKKNIYTMFSTNGQLLAQNVDMLKLAKPNRIIVSLDGLTNATYSKYRVGGDVQNVFDGLEKLSELSPSERPFIELQFLVFSYNEHEIPELKKLAKKYRIDKLTLKSAQIYEDSQMEFLPKNKKYSRYKTDSQGNFVVKKHSGNHCKRLVFGSVICYDGRVVPCCFDKDADFEFGNIKHQTLLEIRNSAEYHNFARKVFSSRNSIKICNNCTE